MNFKPAKKNFHIHNKKKQVIRNRFSMKIIL